MVDRGGTESMTIAGRAWACAVVVIAGTCACGRIGFDPQAAGDGGGGGDGPGGPSVCPANVLICDGFEAPTLDPRWSPFMPTGTSAPDTTHAYRGAQAMHNHTDAVTGMDPGADVNTSQGLAGGAVTGTVYARAFLFLPIALPSPTLQLLNFSDDVGKGISFSIKDGFVVNNDYGSSIFRQSATAVPIGRWVCVELEIPSGTVGTSRISLDGGEIVDVAITKGTVQPAPTHIYVGIDYFNAGPSVPAVDVWIDELIVDDKPTSCAE
jgi:hypothetical protein